MRGAGSLRSLLETIGGFSEIAVNPGIHPLSATAVAEHWHYGSVSFEQDREGRLRVTRCPHPDLQALLAFRDERIREAEIVATSSIISKLATQRTKTPQTVYHTMNHETDSTDPTTAP